MLVSMGNKEPEQLLITIQYEKQRSLADLLAKEIAEKGHTVVITKHMDLWEANPVSIEGKVVNHEGSKP